MEKKFYVWEVRYIRKLCYEYYEKL